jgi:hypothetical protein
MILLNYILKEDRQKKPHNRAPVEIEESVIRARKKLQETKYTQIGVNAINRELHLYGILLNNRGVKYIKITEDVFIKNFFQSRYR